MSGLSLGGHVQGYQLPRNVVATTAAQEAIEGAQYALHAVPVQHSREFLSGIAVWAQSWMVYYVLSTSC